MVHPRPNTIMARYRKKVSGHNIGSPANTCVRFTKTSKTPLMMSVAFGPTSCSSGLVPKSKLLHRPESHDGFVPTLDLWSLATIGTQEHCHHGGKNHALRAKKQDYRYPYIVDSLENVHVASLFFRL